jgi:signal transduction histidine kinase
MLSNLIKNAVESIEYGEVVYVCVEETQSSQAKICIHNPGIIPEEIQKSFGQKYSTLGKISGTGLGVYSARLIANTMNGVFDWSTSREDGTYVYLYLPRPEET